jgi:hypothetical protein
VTSNVNNGTKAVITSEKADDTIALSTIGIFARPFTYVTLSFLVSIEALKQTNWTGNADDRSPVLSLSAGC